MKESLEENERFLTLFGVITNGHHMLNVIQPDVQKIKQQFFQKDPDEPIIFHRKDIVRYRGVFSSLYGNKEKRQEFADTMLAMYQKWEYTTIIITIDKRKHLQDYSVWRYEPYHYCLAVLLERYILYLQSHQLRGDVMIEARGTKPDRKLSESFTQLFENGTNFVPASAFQAHLTSRKIKIRRKSTNVAGLQLADLLAHAAHYDWLAQQNYVEKQNSEYARQVAMILNRDKYNRSPAGEMVGYGKKMLP